MTDYMTTELRSRPGVHFTVPRVAHEEATNILLALYRDGPDRVRGDYPFLDEDPFTSDALRALGRSGHGRRDVPDSEYWEDILHVGVAARHLARIERIKEDLGHEDEARRAHNISIDLADVAHQLHNPQYCPQ